MPILELHPLTADLLPDTLVLDQRALGGLWTKEGYQREIDSPNSDLLVLKQGRGVEGSGTRGWGLGKDEEIEKPQNNLQSSISSPLTPHPSLLTPHSSLLAIGCSWAIAEEAHITLLAVDPHYQQQGLGQALLYVLLKAAHERGLERATLEVRVSNQAALLLYKKFGFREAGRRKRYYQDTGEDALVLWRGGLQNSDFLRVLSEWQQQVCDRLHQSGWQLDSNWDALCNTSPMSDSAWQQS